MRINLSIAVAAVMLMLPASVFGQDVDRMFYVKVTKATQLSGQVIELEEFKVETSFGNVTIPLDKIEAVKMRSDGADAAVIALTNGDMITGKIEIDELHLKTNWGKAHIEAASIEAFSASPYGRFYTDSTGAGWRYSRGTAAKAGAAGANSFQNTGGTFQGSSNPFGNQ
jgi:hypothetical protein